MIFAFLPPLFPDRRYPKATVAFSRNESKAVEPLDPVRAKQIFAATAILILLSLATLLFGLPTMDATANALRPRHSQAYAALETIKQHLNQKREPLWLIVEGRNESEVARRLDEVEPVLARAVSNQTLAGFTLPTALWPETSTVPLITQLPCTSHTTGVPLEFRVNVTRAPALMFTDV